MTDRRVGRMSAPSALRSPWGARVAYHGPPLLFFAVLTFLLAFPVVACLFGNRVPGPEGDNLYYVRSMWWWKRALVDLHISPFLDTTAFYPVGHLLAYSEMTPTNTLLFLPVTILFGPEFSYNFALLFSFVATGLGTYLWIHYLTGSRAAGLLAGTMVAFLPFRFAHLIGHMPQVTTQWIPLALYSFERFRDSRATRDAVWLGIWGAFTIVGCWYYGYALAIVFPVYAVARTLGQWTLWRDRAWWTGILASAAVAAAIVAPFLYQMLKLSSEGRLDRTLPEMQSWALNWYDPFIPNFLHPLWGETMSRWFPKQWTLWVEKEHTLSLAALAAAGIGLVAWRRARRDVVVPLVSLWILSYAIALGPLLKSGDEPVRVPVPEAVARFAAGLTTSGRARPEIAESFVEQGVPVPLPSAFLYKFVPFTSSMRVMARFSIWTAIATAGLAAFGLLTLMSWGESRWGPPARGAIAASLIALVSLESLSHIPTMLVGPRAVDMWLAEQPDKVVIAELPVDQGTRYLQNYWATRHGRRTFFGWAGDSFAPPVMVERMNSLRSFPAPEAIARLRQARVTYVLLTPSQIAGWEQLHAQVRAEPALEYFQTFGDVQVYRVVPPTRSSR